MAKKLVWLNIQTGEFSNSWCEKEYENIDDCSLAALIKGASKGPWKLIKYECINDEEFELSHMMRIK